MVPHSEHRLGNDPAGVATGLHRRWNRNPLPQPLMGAEQIEQPHNGIRRKLKAAVSGTRIILCAGANLSSARSREM
jgi:hypothetical protein